MQNDGFLQTKENSIINVQSICLLKTSKTLQL